ncbi:GAP family protein [Nocardioides taihuensis]|uniref:GAP family protein n=1 Tax=Nocardioides taihuensis TaxID=1835606 RepID=A0ABW0BQ10_9ACTN
MEEALLAAVGIAASPFAVVPAVLLLFAARPGACSAGFAAGWAVGVGAVTASAVVLADVLTLPDAPPSWVSWARVALGVLLVVYGAVKLVRRPGGEPEVPGWMRSLEEATPRSALRFGLLASAPNPKVALLALAGGFSLGADTDGGARELGLVVAFTALATSTAAAPVLAHLALGDRALRSLGRVKDWLVTHLDAVMGSVLVVIGAAVLWKGVGGL